MRISAQASTRAADDMMAWSRLDLELVRTATLRMRLTRQSATVVTPTSESGGWSCGFCASSALCFLLSVSYGDGNSDATVNELGTETDHAARRAVARSGYKLEEPLCGNQYQSGWLGLS